MKATRVLLIGAICAAAGIAPRLCGLSAQAQDAPTEVYAVGNDVSAPRLAPVIFTPPASGTCGQKTEGKVQLSMVVDANGHPRNIMFTKPLANDLDKLALVAVEAERFTPAMRNNVPVAVGQIVDVSLKACVVQQNDSAKQTRLILRLRTVPEQKFKNDSSLRGEMRFAPEEGFPLTPAKTAAAPSNQSAHTSAPILLVSPYAEYTEQARFRGLTGICLISLIVDEHGLPRNQHVIKALGDGLDGNALAAVSRYRFKPAMKDGMPVPAIIVVEVNFRL